jgi:AcrR family transcriptional regulator
MSESPLQPSETNSMNAGPDLATILDAAADLVVHDGIDAVTFRSLARRTGADESTLAEQFLSVEHVMIRMLKREYGGIAETILDHVDRDPRGGLLSRIYYHTLSALYERPLARALYVVEPGALNRIMRTGAGMQYQPSTPVRSEFIARMVELGMARDVDPFTVAAMLSAFSAGLAITAPDNDLDLAITGMEYVLRELVDADVDDTRPGKIAFSEYARSLAEDARRRA